MTRKPHRSKFEEKSLPIIEVLESKDLSQIERIIKNEKWESLSNESKMVVMLVLDIPAEYFKLLTTKTGRITRASVKNFMLRRWPEFIVNYVLEELRKWVKSF